MIIAVDLHYLQYEINIRHNDRKYGIFFYSLNATDHGDNYRTCLRGINSRLNLITDFKRISYVY